MTRRERPQASHEFDPSEDRPHHRPRRARSSLLTAEPGELVELSEEDRERWRIYLVAISPVGESHYRLDFVEGGTSQSVVLEYLPKRGIVISYEFSTLFEGRATADEALKALGRFIAGKVVDFPVEIGEDGGHRPCS